MICILVQIAAAQAAGLISGTVKEGIEQRTLPGAVLRLDKFNRYTVSDKNGYFEFLNVPDGEYRVEVTYLGYMTAYQNVTVKEGGNSVMEFLMQEDSKVLNEVVVMGDQARGQAKAFNQQKQKA